MNEGVLSFFAVYQENWPDWGPQIYTAIGVTIELTIASFALAAVLGLLLAVGKMSRLAFVRGFCVAYIEVARGVPALAVLFLLYFGLVPLGIVLDAFYAGFIGLGMSGAGYIAEVFRAGIQSVPRDQSQAGTALGLTDRQVMRKIILPQAVRNMLPALGNDLIALMKDTSLVSVLAVRELTQMARLYSGSSFRFRESFFVLMVIYVVLTLGLSLLLRWYERRIAIPGY